MKQGINFLKLLKGHTSGWVAISSDFNKVVLSGKTLKALRGQTKDRKKETILFLRREIIQ